LKTEPYIGHCVLPVTQSGKWKQFEDQQGTAFKKRFRGNAHKLERIGKWEISSFEDDKRAVGLSKLWEIEKYSWKEEWRTKKGREDKDLSIITETSEELAKRMSPEFDYSVWLLKLNDSPIAYNLVLKYKQTAYFVKTSYIQKYHSLSPGIFLWNEMIHKFLDEQKVSNIDFLTEMPFMRIWTNQCRQRTRFLITKGLVPTEFVRLYSNPYLRKIATSSLGLLS
jgi:CelD/BcsL family acetyltransferase involved in cellulose biosynthesis